MGPLQVCADQDGSLQMGIGQVQSNACSLTNLCPVNWPASVFMCCQEPLNFSARQRHIFERGGMLLTTWESGHMLGKRPLALGFDFRLGPPGLTLFPPIA